MSHHVPHTPHLAPAPDRYGELARFLPRTADRAAALNVGRSLIRAVDEGRPVRTGALPAARVNLIADACELLTDRLGDPVAAGRFLLDRDEHGCRHAALLRHHGPQELEDLAVRCQPGRRRSLVGVR